MNEPTVVPDSALDYGPDLIVTLDGVAFTGIAYEDSPAHGRSELSYREGLQDGPARDWYPSGVLKGESPYVQGVIHGFVKEFAESGQLLSEVLYTYGIRVLIRQYLDGSLVSELRVEPDDFTAELLSRLRAEWGWPPFE